MKMRAKHLSLLLLLAMPSGCELDFGGKGKSSGATGGSQPNNDQFTEPESTDAEDNNESTGASSGEGSGSDSTDDGGLPGGTEVPGEDDSDDKDSTTEEGTPDKEDVPGEESEPAECEEGAEKACSETEDGEAIDFPTGVPLGNCKAGSKVCKDGVWGSCEGAVAPEEADSCEKAGDDANCDGSANGGCDCVNGESRPCGESDKGQCKMGTQTCTEGKWPEECDGAIYPDKEKCDGKNIDEDCDGTADLDDGDCNCIDGSTEYCERAGQKGDCKWGQKSCTDGQWSGCQEWAKSETEICGSRPEVTGIVWTGDENCDGQIDSSSFGKPGPQGCEKMMLDQDGDGYGKMGKDLSEISGAKGVPFLATACLCPDRPDMAKKKAEGWVPATDKANKDCGDCAGDKGGEDVYPGSMAKTTEANACLEEVKWTVGSTRPSPGYYDLNCDRKHTDPHDIDNMVGQIKCKFDKSAGTCKADGKGRLIGIAPQGLWCGGTFQVATCEPETKMVKVPGSTKTIEKMVGCNIEPTGSKHVIHCR